MSAVGVASSTLPSMNITWNDDDVPRQSALTSAGPLGTILSIWAHPDDETYLAGGIMAAARDRGQRVVCASATAGEHGTTDPAAWPPSRLGRVRRWESAAAMAILGVREHHVLGLPDGALDDGDEVGVAWAARLIDDVAPDTILTFGRDGMTFHRDHVAVHRWVTRAWNERGRRSRLLYAAPTVEELDRFGDLYESWDVYMSDERPVGVPESDLAAHVRISGAELDRKVAALRAMATQTGDVVASLGLEAYSALVAQESFVDARRVAPGILAHTYWRDDPEVGAQGGMGRGLSLAG